MFKNKKFTKYSTLFTVFSLLPVMIMMSETTNSSLNLIGLLFALFAGVATYVLMAMEINSESKNNEKVKNKKQGIMISSTISIILWGAVIGYITYRKMNIEEGIVSDQEALMVCLVMFIVLIKYTFSCTKAQIIYTGSLNHENK